MEEDEGIDGTRGLYITQKHNFVVRAIENNIYVIGKLSNNIITPLSAADKTTASELGLKF